MANVKDILLDSDYDLIVKNGDFYINDSDQQHIDLIIRCYKGAYKQFPLLGVGIDLYVAASGQSNNLKQSIITNLLSDSYKVSDIAFNISVDKFEMFTNAERIPQTNG